MAEHGPMAFQGAWNVRRTIVDRLTSAKTSFAGEAFITPVQFEEHGDLISGGTSLRSSRTYRLICTERELTVCFPDMSEFIHITGDPVQCFVHSCGPDLYRGTMMFRSADTWAETWLVTGPRKNYRSLARYQRVAA